MIKESPTVRNPLTMVVKTNTRTRGTVTRIATVSKRATGTRSSRTEMRATVVATTTATTLTLRGMRLRTSRKTQAATVKTMVRDKIDQTPTVTRSHPMVGTKIRENTTCARKCTIQSNLRARGTKRRWNPPLIICSSLNQLLLRSSSLLTKKKKVNLPNLKSLCRRDHLLKLLTTSLKHKLLATSLKHLRWEFKLLILSSNLPQAKWSRSWATSTDWNLVALFKFTSTSWRYLVWRCLTQTLSSKLSDSSDQRSKNHWVWTSSLVSKFIF